MQPKLTRFCTLEDNFYFILGYATEGRTPDDLPNGEELHYAKCYLEFSQRHIHPYHKLSHCKTQGGTRCIIVQFMDQKLPLYSNAFLWVLSALLLLKCMLVCQSLAAICQQSKC